MSVHYRDLEHAYVYWIWLRGSASYVISVLTAVNRQSDIKWSAVLPTQALFFLLVSFPGFCGLSYVIFKISFVAFSARMWSLFWGPDPDHKNLLLFLWVDDYRLQYGNIGWPNVAAARSRYLLLDKFQVSLNTTWNSVVLDSNNDVTAVNM